MRVLLRLAVASIGVGGLWATGARAANATPGGEGTSPACCQLTTSLAQDVLAGPDLTGDERFFTGGEGAPPNLHLILDTSAAMIEQPIIQASDYVSFFSAGLGCSNTVLNAYQLANGWSPATVYPPPDPGTGYGNDHLGDWDAMLGAGTQVWRMMSWSDQLYQNKPPTPAYATFDTACASLHDPTADALKYDACRACLGTAGYWFDPGYTFPSATNHDPFGWASSSTLTGHYLMTANLLRFLPPKYVTAMATLKKVVTHLSRIRSGMTVLSGDSGGSLIQPQNPPCNKALAGASNADRAPYVNAVNNLGFHNDTPLGEALLNVGQYFSADPSSKSATPYDTVYGFGSTLWSKGGFIKKGPSDQNFSNNVNGGNQNRTVCWGCQTSAVVIISGGEPTRDAQLPVAQLESLNGGEVTCPAAAPCAIETADHADSFLDDVAKFLYTHDLEKAIPPVIGDLNTAGDQVVTTFGIALGNSSNLLRNAASVGGGVYLEAHDAASLEAALTQVIDQVKTRATSFSAASVSTLQVNRTGGSILPRFQPSRLGRAAPWDGSLYRFELGSEAFFGCKQSELDAALKAKTPYPADLNLDGTCDIVLLDKNGKAVLESDDGQFVLYTAPNTPAEPYWEAGQVLQTAPGDGGTVWQSRFIVTVVDSSGDGKIDHDDAPIEFSEANAAALEPYFGISDSDPAPCPKLAARLGEPDAGALSGLECAKTIIRYYRGADVLNPDPALRGQDQPHLLKDIFHSSPVTVQPPSPKAFCSATTQCTETLFRTSLKAESPDAYQSYVDAKGKRDKLVLVGANDGMLHAFDDGSFQEEDPTTGTYVYTAGSGKEELAFVPPDLLPKLRLHLGEHAFLVDAAPMVREVWIDADGDGWKDADEFRTVAIVNEGHGGVHHYALDLTEVIPEGGPAGFDAAAKARLLDPAQSRFFLWMWPQACDPAALQVGESFGNYAPRPPPIGAVAIHDPDGHLGTIAGVPAREDWVVMFNGGHDQYLSRGRGLAMVEVATGNTLWSAWGNPASSGLEREMRSPFSAGISMLDIGGGGTSGSEGDYIFDTATVPDFAGNVWTVRFWQPGELEGGGVTNWSFARAFSASADGGITGEPMTQMTANTLQPSTGYLRTYVGTGDRFHLTDIGGPHCRFSNPYACAEVGCGAGTAASPVTVSVHRGSPSDLAAVGTLLATGTAGSATLYTSADAGPAIDGSACSYSAAKVSLAYPTTCAALTSAALELVCAADGGGFGCETTNASWATPDPVDVTGDTSITGSYYGFVSYGGSHVFEADGGSTAYDDQRLTPAALTDVSPNNGVASPVGEGWRIHYQNGGGIERTATGSAIIDGCVIWNSLQPASRAGPICATAGANTAYLYQANAETGGTGCFEALGGQRSLARTVVAIPGEPEPQRQLIDGHATSSVINLEAGRAEGQTVRNGGDLIQTVYQIEVDRPAHKCRHEGSGCP